MNNFLVSYQQKLDKKSEVYLSIKVRPRAAKTEIVGKMDDDVLKINIAAPPIGGKANIELIKFFAKEFGVTRDCVKIISGAGGRGKLVKIINL